MSSTPIFAHINRQTLDAANPAPYIKGVKRGVSEELVRQISKDKCEPQWMLKHRLESLNIFYEKEMPEWGADLSSLNLDDIIIKNIETLQTMFEHPLRLTFVFTNLS